MSGLTRAPMPHRPGPLAPSIVALFGVVAVCLAQPGVRQASPATPFPGSPTALDPQHWQDQQDMTWADYRPIPGVNWADPSKAPDRALRVALVAIDFEDQPFVITKPRQSDPFGNPQIDPIRREDVPRFYAGFWGTPGTLNHGHTIHEYWMEQSRGKVGIPMIDSYGPYRMPRRLFEYGLNEYGQAAACPTGFTCNGRMEPDADALWSKDAGADVRSKYDVVLRIYAGYDETSVWQEFGEMKFKSRDEIPAEWGNPDTTKPRWAVTRYVPWTSWLAGAQQWGLSSVRQGESSGTLTHEIAHLAFRTGDNNNNPYVTPYRRVGSGPWDIMDRGSFNGPGGPHRRWVVPASEGASMPAGFTLRNRLRFEFVRPEQVLRLSREGLAKSGLAVATIVARAVDPGPSGLAGVQVSLDGDPQDRTPSCNRDADPLCAGDAVFNDYTIEVVQRIGVDSFTPESGVLVAKNKDRESPSCGYNCFTWVIDARPGDVNRVDFVRPDGTRVMRTAADYRQLNDALFHAGLDSGSAFEWEDRANRLHFYVIDRRTDANGILSYVVAARSLDGNGPHTRGVTASGPGALAVRPGASTMAITVRNTGTASPTAAGFQPNAPASVFEYDVFRLSVAVEGRGWASSIANALVALKPGQSTSVPVAVSTGAGAGRITLTATSESDATKKASAVTAVTVR